MAYPVTLNGRTYTLADFEGTNYVNGFPDALEDFVTQAGNIYTTTSTSSVAIGTGSKTFTVADSGKPYIVGTPLRIADSAAPSTNWIDGVVTSYSGTTLVVDAVAYAGSGTIASWNINIGGSAIAYTGTLPIAQGGTGATTAAAARTNIDVYSKGEADSRFLNVSDEASDVTISGQTTFNDLVFVNTAGQVITTTSGTGAVLSSDSVSYSHQFSRATPNVNSAVMVLNDTGFGGDVLDLRYKGASFGLLRTDAGNNFILSDNAGTDRITIWPGGQIIFNGEANTSNTFLFKIEESGTSAAPDIRIYRDSSTPADDDSLGSIQYSGNNSNGDEFVAANMRAVIVDVTAGTEDTAYYVTTDRGGVEKIDFFTRGGRMGLTGRNWSGFLPSTHLYDPNSLLELRSGTVTENRIYFNQNGTIRDNWIGMDTDADTLAISADSSDLGTSSTLKLRVDNFGYLVLGDTDESTVFNMGPGGFRVQRGATSGVPIEFKATSDSGTDLNIKVGGARTGLESDIAVISLRNYSDQSTGGDYDMANLIGMDPVADATQKKGAFVVRTRNGSSLQSGLIVDHDQRVILSRRGGTDTFNGIPTNVDSTTRCFIDQPTTGSAYHTLWVASDGGSGDPAITVSGPGSAYTPSCKIFGDGDIENTNNSYGTLASERRFKQDIIDASSQWDDIKALSWKKFRLKEDVEKLGDEAPVQLGLIIDELEQVSPGLVNSKEVYATREIPVLDENGVQKTDEDGNPLTEQERYLSDTVKGYKTSVIFMKGMIALQEAMARIEQLEAEIATLKQ